MNFKWLGTLVVILGCGGMGLRMACQSKMQTSSLYQLIGVLEYMETELQYRMPPLPELCGGAWQYCAGSLRQVMQQLSRELNSQVAPDAWCCMRAVLSKHSELPGELRTLLEKLGRTLGRFDLEGQLSGIRSVRREAAAMLERLRKDQPERIRSYQTLGLCAGAALAILFL